MPTFARDHQTSMKVVCGVCTCKSKNLRTISPILLVLIKKHHFDQYDLDTMPNVICLSCIPTLKEIDEKGIEAKRTLPLIDYSEFTLKNTRLQEQKKNGLFCDCKWCWIAQLKNKEYEKYYNSIKKVGRPGTIEKAEATPLCSLCLGRSGKGVSHHCTKEAKYKSLVEIASASKVDADRVTAKLINKKCEDELVSKKIGTFSLTSGRNKNLIVGFGDKPMPQLKHQDMVNLKVDAKVTDRQLNLISARLRNKLKMRNIIEPGSREVVTQKARN